MKLRHQNDQTVEMSREIDTSKLIIRLASGREFVITADADKLCVQSFPNLLVLSNLMLDRVCVSYEDNQT